MADFERDPIVRPDPENRSQVPLGRGFGLWQRMNPGVELVWVTDAEGRPRAITPTQAGVASLAMTMIDGEMLTMRAMAARLGVSPSTVSRALTKLASWGLIAYIVGRGRYAGLVIIKRAKNDGLDRFRKAAQARVRRWRESAERRYLSVKINVASTLHGRGKGVDSLYYFFTDTKSATLKQPWGWDEIEEALR